MDAHVLMLFANLRSFIEDNQLMFANALLRLGCRVTAGALHSVSQRNGRIWCQAVKVDQALKVGDGYDNTELSSIPADTFDFIWVMSVPHPAMATDIYQMLWILNKKVKFINTTDAMLFLNNKSALSAYVPSGNLIEAYTSNEYTDLASIYRDNKHVRWIVKPTNEGCGRDVFLLEPGSMNNKALLQSQTGNALPEESIKERPLTGVANRYCVLQRYITNVRGNEKRIVLAGGKLITFYHRLHMDDDHRGNLFHGAGIELCELTSDESNLVSNIGHRLLDLGVRYTALDIAFPYVIEINMVNPGGIPELFRVTGVDLSDTAVASVMGSFK
jgi:glutathione synthase